MISTPIQGNEEDLKIIYLLTDVNVKFIFFNPSYIAPLQGLDSR